MAVTFDKNASNLTFPTGKNRNWPVDDSEKHDGVILRTAAGIIAFDERMAANPLQIPLQLTEVVPSFYNDLYSWFTTVCHGKLYKFNYSNGVTGESNLSVRWINGFDFNYSKRYHSGLIILEKEIE